MHGSIAAVLGLIIAVLGIILILIGLVSRRTSSATETKTFGLFLVGPLPIVFRSNSFSGVLLGVFIFVVFLVVIFLLLMFL